MAQTPGDLDPSQVWGACSLATCLGLRACCVSISQLVKGTRLAAFLRVNQLPDWWMGWGLAVEANCGQAQARSCLKKHRDQEDTTYLWFLKLS